MTEETNQTTQTATDQTAQPAQATDATQATQAINAESTTSTTTGSTTGSTTGVTVGITTEATTQTATGQTTQPVQSAQSAQSTTVTQELTQKEFWVSGMLNGTFYECDGPYYTTKDIPAENYPYTTVTPNPSFTSQKYDYLNHKWVDTSADALLHEMESMKTAINSFQQMATTLQQGLDSQSQAQEAKDEEIEKAMSLFSMVIKQMGTISDKIDGISTKLSATTPTATTTQTASTTTTTDAVTPAGSTTQTDSATPTATTTQTADETKKEGTN